MSHETLVREFARLRLEAERLAAEAAALQVENTTLRGALDEARTAL